jgi:aromatic ring-cleaving dioxygenase
MLKTVLLLTLAVVIFSHPTYYPEIKQKCDDTTKILSWHIHIVYTLTNPDEYKKAMVLREKAKEYFKDYVGDDCKGRFDTGRLCFIDDHPLDKVLLEGPFPSGEWSMFVPVSHFALVVPWFSINRGDFSYLVHPNTGCMWEDHSIWSFWVGQAWPIDLTIFDKGEQVSEEDHEIGDLANPSCIGKSNDKKEKLACGHPDFNGPALACCSGFTCVCDKADKDCKCVATPTTPNTFFLN